MTVQIPISFAPPAGPEPSPSPTEPSSDATPFDSVLDAELSQRPEPLRGDGARDHASGRSTGDRPPGHGDRTDGERVSNGRPLPVDADRSADRPSRPAEVAPTSTAHEVASEAAITVAGALGAVANTAAPVLDTHVGENAGELVIDDVAAPSGGREVPTSTTDPGPVAVVGSELVSSELVSSELPGSELVSSESVRGEVMGTEVMSAETPTSHDTANPGEGDSVEPFTDEQVELAEIIDGPSIEEGETVALDAQQLAAEVSDEPAVGRTGGGEPADRSGVDQPPIAVDEARPLDLDELDTEVGREPAEPELDGVARDAAMDDVGDELGSIDRLAAEDDELRAAGVESQDGLESALDGRDGSGEQDLTSESSTDLTDLANPPEPETSTPPSTSSAPVASEQPTSAIAESVPVAVEEGVTPSPRPDSVVAQPAVAPNIQSAAPSRMLARRWSRHRNR